MTTREAENFLAMMNILEQKDSGGDFSLPPAAEGFPMGLTHVPLHFYWG